jgi:hypothetical protein
VFAAQAHQGLVIHGREVHDFDGAGGFARHCGGAGRKTGLGRPFVLVRDLESLNQLVGEEVPGDMFHLGPGQAARDQELGGRVDRDAGVLG